MRSPNQFIVKPLNDSRYLDTIDIDGIRLIVSTSQEDASSSNREAIVMETPLVYDGPISVGDHLLVHHNVFKFYYDMKGRQRNGRSYFKDGLFFIDDMQYFMWRKSDGDWQTVGDVCFIEPIGEKESWIQKFTDLEPLQGVIRYRSDSLEGADVGDEVLFRPNSEYEFRIHGRTMYRVFNRAVVINMSYDGERV
jgi:hypothetical protein